jgi:olfactory receptor
VWDAGVGNLGHRCHEFLATELHGDASVLLCRDGNSTLFCEPNQLVHLACSGTFLNNIEMNLVAGFLGGGPLTGILYSYSKIISSIHAISSAQGKYKAFSTCASHLSVVSLFYCTILGVYLSSAVTQNSHSTAKASGIYSVVTPMLNPFIYCLRNKDIKKL